MTGPTRRGVIASAAGAALAPGAAWAAGLEGRTIYSESAQLSLGDPAGGRFVTLRICQYPDAGVAWLWAAALIDGRFALFADNHMSWSGAPSVREGAEEVAYAVDGPPAQAAFTRAGPRRAPTACTARFARRGGAVAFAAEAAFTPAAGVADLVPGRSETFGRGRAEVRLGARTVVIEGPGQWHEQPQTDPRFVTPFVYASLWGRDVFATLLETPDDSGGYVIRPDGVERLSRVRFAPPDARRPALIAGEGGDRTLTLREARAYAIGIYGRRWRGAFVRTAIDGAPLIGFANTWPATFRGGPVQGA